MVSCAMVGAYSSSVLTGSVSSSSVVPPRWLIAMNYSLVHDAMLQIKLWSCLLTGSVFSSSSVVPPRWLIAMNYSLVHDAMSLRCMSLKSMVFQLLLQIKW